MGTLDGVEIDNHDVVIRMDRRLQSFKESHMAEFGSKTDIYLYNARSIRKLIKDNQLQLIFSIDFLLTRRSCNVNSANSKLSIAAIQVHEYPGTFYKSMNAIPAVLFYLSLSEASTVTLFTANFYTSTEHHADGFSIDKKQNARNYTLKNLHTVLANHDLLMQKNKVNSLWRIGACNLQLETAKIISLNKEEYLKKVIDSIFPNTKYINKVNRELKKLVNQYNKIYDHNKMDLFQL
jgi:hypothetical protein